jgi:hypothetical protein
MSVALFSFPVGRQKWAFLLDLINTKLLMSVTCSEEYRHIWGLILTQLENSVPINQLKSIISIYFSGPKGV